MIESIKENIFTNWHLARWIRLVLGLAFLGQTIYKPELFASFLAFFLLFQAITNSGCCGVGGCAVNTNPVSDKKSEEVDFEEVKP